MSSFNPCSLSYILDFFERLCKFESKFAGLKNPIAIFKGNVVDEVFPWYFLFLLENSIEELIFKVLSYMIVYFRIPLDLI